MKAFYSLALVALLASLSFAQEKTASIGLAGTDIEKKEAQKQRLPVSIGVKVARVIPDSAADEAGLQDEDVIHKIDNTAIQNVAKLRSWLETVEDREYKVQILRSTGEKKWARKTLKLKPRFIAARKDTSAELNKWSQEQGALPKEQQAFEIKGDRLGLPLEFFKNKYYRVVSGEVAPFCSDRRPQLENPFLAYKPYYSQAGIVCATIHFPFEEIASKDAKITVAKVPVELFIYKFIDEKLYEMSFLLDHADFSTLQEAFTAKYGKPTASTTSVYTNGFGAKFSGDSLAWQNKVSSIALFERAGKVDQSFAIISHIELGKLADERIKALAKDDL
jgi:hypothetical protein